MNMYRNYEEPLQHKMFSDRHGCQVKARFMVFWAVWAGMRGSNWTLSLEAGQSSNSDDYRDRVVRLYDFTCSTAA